MVAVAVASCADSFLTVMVYVVSMTGLTVVVPSTSVAPAPKFELDTDVAFVELHVNVVAPPDSTDAGSADNVTLGNPETFTTTLSVATPPVPETVIV